MLRRPFYTACGICWASILVVCVLLTLGFAAGAIWPIKFQPYPDGNYETEHFFVASGENHILQVCVITHPLTFHGPSRSGGSRDVGEDTEWKEVVYWRGFMYMQTDAIDNWSNVVTRRYWDFRIPYWMMTMAGMGGAVLLGAAPVWRRYRRRATDPESRPCRHCQYDLRAHGVGGRCPECGTQIDAKSAR